MGSLPTPTSVTSYRSPRATRSTTKMDHAIIAPRISPFQQNWSRSTKSAEGQKTARSRPYGLPATSGTCHTGDRTIDCQNVRVSWTTRKARHRRRRININERGASRRHRKQTPKTSMNTAKTNVHVRNIQRQRRGRGILPAVATTEQLQNRKRFCIPFFGICNVSQNVRK